MEYTAKGGGKFLTIGNLRANNTTITSSQGVYYVFDNFSISTTVCAAGDLAPNLGNANVIAETLNLNSMVTGTPPANAVLEWHTVPNPSDNSTKLANTTVVATSIPASYYAVYHSTSGSDCYSPSAKLIVVSNDCPEKTVNLTSFSYSPIPLGSNLVWYKNATHTIAVSDETAVEEGTYWAFFYDSVNHSYTSAGAPVVVISTKCACYPPAAQSGLVLETSVGITSLNRAGAEEDNWPMVRNGGWLALESKTKGFVVNRVAFTDADNNPVTRDVPVGIPETEFVEGMLVYDTTNKCLKMYTIKAGEINPAWHCMSKPACPENSNTGGGGGGGS